MKRKFLSTLLFGALACTTLSTVTSCKDYDDDINGLQEQINKLATADQLASKVSELQALISANSTSISSLQTALAEAKKAAENAQTTADSKATLDEVKTILADYATKKYVDDADAALSAAIKALQTGDIADLKAAVAEAKTAADAAAEKADKNKTEILEQLKTLATKAELAETKEAAEKLANDLVAASDAKNAEALAAAVNTMNQNVAEAKQELLTKIAECATKAELADVKKGAEDASKLLKEELQAEIALCASQKALDEAIQAGKDADAAAAELNKAEREKVAQAAQAALDAKVAELEAKIQKAQAKADKAESEEGLAYIKAVEALGEAGKAATAAATAQGTADTNKTNIDKIEKKLGEGFDEKNTVAAAIDLIKADLNVNGEGALAGLSGRLSAIEGILTGVADDDTKLGLSTKVANIENDLKGIIGDYSTMVTDIQLYNFSNVEDFGFDETLNFIQAAEQENVFPATAGITDKQLTFTKGKYYAGEDSLLIRVSPVDAELTTSNVSLLNSQGKELDDLIEVTSVSRFNGLLTLPKVSRAAGVNTGLWVVKFKAKDLGDDFKAAAETKDGKNSILYAVAVKNTYKASEEASTRRVTSEYGVDLTTTNADHQPEFSVNDIAVSTIHNRYKNAEDGTSTENVPELVWTGDAATTVITIGENANAANRHDDIDNRQDNNILAVVKGEPITIDFANGMKAGVKGFYVTLDEKFAVESAPSELNAWNSYSYKGVGYKKNGTTAVPATLFEGGRGQITIENLGNVKGDVIGFRVYAVNYDGTLTDPDGRSFYVAVGDVKGVKNLGNSDLTLNAAGQFESTVALPADFSEYDFNGFTGWEVTAKDASGITPTDFKVVYLNEKNEVVETLTKDVKSIKFILTDPQKFIDGATYNVSTTLTTKISSATANVCTVNASFTKVMPTEAPIFGYRDGFSATPEYLVPADNSYEVETDEDGNIVNKSGYFDFRNILIINNNKTWNGADLFESSTFNFTVANGTYKTENNKTNLVAAEANYDANWKLNVQNGKNNLVDNTTSRTITANYIYENISKKYNAESKKWVNEPYPVPSPSKENIVYCAWSKTFKYDVDSHMEEQTIDKKKVMVETNTWLADVITKDEDGKDVNNGSYNTVEWKSAGATNTKKFDLANVPAKVADLKLLPVKAGVNGETLYSFLAAKTLVVVPGEYGTAYTTDNNGVQINPYFSAKIVGGTITLTQKSQGTIPSSVKGGKIHFTVADCFGNKFDITLPFNINVKETAARKH